MSKGNTLTKEENNTIEKQKQNNEQLYAKIIQEQKSDEQKATTTNMGLKRTLVLLNLQI